jgi:DNA mismatch repair protein MutL
MADIIRLLPESVANQIAAGEVVQRPASAVKELMENSIDAGASVIRLVVKEAGKTLIQVTDNGKGMSATDARMSFERHATSKIKSSDDLFHIVTKGFRGEALASIAAVAHVEMRTKQASDELGTLLCMEGSKCVQQEWMQCPEGTTIMVKNLFFNVPARRYFLKSDAIEFRHIVDEFQRLALTHPDVEFSLAHNGSEVFSLPKASLRQRIVHVFGAKYQEKLVPVEESTDIVSVSGFIGKLDVAKKTRGEQFFFVNNRFIKSTYLNHAVMAAFEQLLPQGHFPLYLLYFTIDPAQIDINIHPTKTEIKFQDERAVYAILHAAVKRALGKHHLSPSIDFDQETAVNLAPLRQGEEVKMPSVKLNPDYNPFGQSAPKKESALAGWFERRGNASATSQWQDLMAISQQMDQLDAPNTPLFEEKEGLDEEINPIQFGKKYIGVSLNGRWWWIDQQRAHRQVLFERYLKQMEQGRGPVQQLLFPEEVPISNADARLLEEMHTEIAALGFDIEIGQNGALVKGLPAEMADKSAELFLQDFLRQYLEEDRIQLTSSEKLAWSLAKSSAVRKGQTLSIPEMRDIVRRLFECEQSEYTRSGKTICKTLFVEQIDEQFS